MIKAVKYKAGCEPEVVEIPEKHTYRDLQALCDLNGSPLDCVVRSIKGRPYDIWCDDEGLLRAGDKPIAGFYHDPRNPDWAEFLVGSILIARHDEEGNLAGLEPDEIEDVMSAGFPSGKLAEWIGKIPTEFGDLKFEGSGKVLIYVL